MNPPETLDHAIMLRTEKRFDEAFRLFTALLAKSPDDALINYHCAWTCDSAGKEGDAVPFYEAALKHGIEGDDRRSTFLGLGSTFRCLGQYEKSLAMFETGIAEFPDYRALKVFKALTLYNLHRHPASVETLLTQLVETTADPSIKDYARALSFYSDKLDETWT